MAGCSASHYASVSINWKLTCSAQHNFEIETYCLERKVILCSLYLSVQVNSTIALTCKLVGCESTPTAFGLYCSMSKQFGDVTKSFLISRMSQIWHG